MGRMVQLNSNAVMESEEVENLFCKVHYPLQLGWGEKRVWEGLPDVVVGLEELTTNITQPHFVIKMANKENRQNISETVCLKKHVRSKW